MKKSNKQQIARLARLLDRRKLSFFLSFLGFGIMSSSVSIITAMLVSTFLDAITEKNMDAVITLCIQFMLIVVAMCILTPLFQYWYGKTVKTIMNSMRLRVFHHMEKLPVTYYENSHSGDSLSRITNDLQTMENAFSGEALTLLSLMATGTISAIIMFYLDWRFAVAMIFLGMLSTYVNSRYAKPFRTIGTEIQEQSGVQLERLTNLVAGTQVSRTFQMVDGMNRKYKETTTRLADLFLLRAKKSAYLTSTNYFLLWINNGGAFIIGAFMLINGQMTIGSLLGVILLLENVTNLFRNLGVFWSNLQSSLAGADRVFDLLDVAEEPERYASVLKEVAVSSSNEDGMLDFKNVSFAYHKDENVLNGLNLHVDKGQLVALVGPSGGGKSTIMKLLLGFYPFSEGDIRIAGKSFAEYSLEELRDSMAYVSQDPYLFEGTIEQNIRYGKMDATAEEVVEAARAAFAHDFITEQTDGYNTAVGERGVRLSGGQKQRIAIARAILKNAPILLLDEATSALDSDSELAVQQGIERLMEGKTTIAIAHRLSTIEQADTIVVVDRGTIMEQGKHDELLAAGGAYSRLYHTQKRTQEWLPQAMQQEA
ncbi:ABC-type multidrug transport system, ATPase and permease component [Paenibacillus algorifonticola]|uniref:ABC-type multidrug transport system, ATPase and permease component n=1 Tax=Paenibacillus algorifonticola TaxID=684063 RepID=A0A1I1YTF4_9BACL|nr:ABC transporter ATP-binding protein [Paenibacillus algorifonticola]SFE22759.1 ABC-type multidrug transport system, ATPase and permease component [Paenibacillus algorifonticola]